MIKLRGSFSGALHSVPKLNILNIIVLGKDNITCPIGFFYKNITCPIVINATVYLNNKIICKN